MESGTENKAQAAVAFFGIYDEADEPIPIVRISTAVPAIPGVGDDVSISDDGYQFHGTVGGRTFEYDEDQEVLIFLFGVSWITLETNGKSGSGLTPEQREFHAPDDVDTPTAVEHHEDCGTKHRGCSPDCKYEDERTRLWIESWEIDDWFTIPHDDGESSGPYQITGIGGESPGETPLTWGDYWVIYIDGSGEEMGAQMMGIERANAKD